jgi:hypothetical protein
MGNAKMLENYDRITHSLEVIKEDGRISDYLVSWKGQGGSLEPSVTVWRKPSSIPEQIKGEIVETLFGLVPETRIVVLAG